MLSVPGNHGENRKNGKAFTTFGDNFDVAIFDEVAEIFQENPAYKHVKFVIPENDLWLTVEVQECIRNYYWIGSWSSVQNWW